MGEVCLDASFALKLVLPESESDQVRLQWAEWIRDGVVMVGPWLLMFEAHSVLRRKVVRGELTESEGREGWGILRRQGIRAVQRPPRPGRTVGRGAPRLRPPRASLLTWPSPAQTDLPPAPY